MAGRFAEQLDVLEQAWRGEPVAVHGRFVDVAAPPFLPRATRPLADLLWIAAIPLGGTLLLLLFPTGQLPSPCWQPVIWAAAAATAIIVAAMALTPGPLEYRRGTQNPLG